MPTVAMTDWARQRRHRLTRRGRVMLFMWAWCVWLLPLLHAIDHELDHVHGQSGVTPVLTTAHSWHSDHHGHHHSHHGHHHHSAGNAEDSPSKATSDGEEAETERSGSDKKRPYQPGHGHGAIQHLQALFEIPELQIAAQGGPLKLLEVLAEQTPIGFRGRAVPRALGCRDPPSSFAISLT